MNLVTISNGKVRTTCIKVAEHYGKRHFDVMQRIENIIKQSPEQNEIFR